MTQRGALSPLVQFEPSVSGMDTLEKPHTKKEFREQESAYLTQKIRCYSQQSQNKAPCRAMYFNLRQIEK